jgi:hypothetical protein
MEETVQSTEKEKQERLNRALVDPASAYPNPEAVLQDKSISSEEKRKILSRWEFDVAELAVATEEGMPHDEEDLTRRILLALGQLDREGKREDIGPGKHHVPSGTAGTSGDSRSP